jgi:hypothetical protein
MSFLLWKTVYNKYAVTGMVDVSENGKEIILQKKM